MAIPLANPQEVQKGAQEIERAFTGNQDLRKLKYRLPTSLAAQSNELEDIYHGMRERGVTHEDGIKLLSDPAFAKFMVNVHRINQGQQLEKDLETQISQRQVNAQKADEETNRSTCY